MKLYVLVRKDLSRSQQAVQSGHAVAEWLLRNPDSPKWSNGTLVYLGVKNEEELHSWMDKLEARCKSTTPFCEPDIGNEVTAIACLSNGKEFRHLRLI